MTGTNVVMLLDMSHRHFDYCRQEHYSWEFEQLTWGNAPKFVPRYNPHGNDYKLISGANIPPDFLSNLLSWEKLNRGGSKPGGFPLFAGKIQIVSRTLSGLFLVGAVNRLRKRKRTNQENPRRVPGQIGKIPEKSGKSEKDKKDKKGRTSPDRETPPFSGPP